MQKAKGHLAESCNLRQPFPRSVALVFLVSFLLVGCAAAQQYETLSEVLVRNSITHPPQEVPHLNALITSYATLNDDREFVIAYYLASPADQGLHFPLLLTGFDKHSRTWRHVSFSQPELRMFSPSRPESDIDCIGSVLNIERNGGWYYLNLHWNPSAGCLLILGHDLHINHMITGWTAAFFKSGQLVYFGNMAHFVSVHPETLFLYDPIEQKSRQIYPQKADPFRKNFSTRLADFIDQKKCAENNWSCDPNKFTIDISDIQVNDQAESLAFRADFETEGMIDQQAAESSGKWYDDQYVYFYRLHPLRWREFSSYDLKSKFGTDSLEELLKPPKLRQIFAASP